MTGHSAPISISRWQGSVGSGKASMKFLFCILLVSCLGVSTLANETGDQEVNEGFPLTGNYSSDVLWAAAAAKFSLADVGRLMKEFIEDFSPEITNNNIRPLLESLDIVYKLAEKKESKRRIQSQFTKSDHHYQWLVLNWEPKFHKVAVGFEEFRKKYKALENVIFGK